MVKAHDFNGHSLEFKNVHQAAEHFHAIGKASSVQSAHKNIRAAIDGQQTTGANGYTHTEDRIMAYSFLWVEK